MTQIVIGLLVLMLLGGLAAIALALYRAQVATVARSRLDAAVLGMLGEGDALEDPVAAQHSHGRSRVLRRYWWLGIPVAVIACAILYIIFDLGWGYLAAAAAMTLLIAIQVDVLFLQRRINKLEQQLADSIDMMVAAVKSGASLQSALESGWDQAERPWRHELGLVIRGIRFGDDPVHALGDLAQRLPLESVILFAQTLAVNWRVGGKLAVTLANVGRTVRDRIELSRRMFAMTTQARLSVISVIAVTYFIGVLMWRNDPERMGGFLTSTVGETLVAGAIILQAVGIVWIAWLSKPKF